LIMEFCLGSLNTEGSPDGCILTINYFPLRPEDKNFIG
jgi:hypothetical protein